MAYHLLPTNDLESHEKTTTCKCEPSVKYEDGEMLVIHNSFDKRELFEEIDEYINIKDNDTARESK